MPIIILKKGDVIKDSFKREGQEGSVNIIQKVTDVNKDKSGNYLHTTHEVSSGGVHSSSTLELGRCEKIGPFAVVPSEFTTDGGVTIHSLKKVKAPEGAKWSYERER